MKSHSDAKELHIDRPHICMLWRVGPAMNWCILTTIAWLVDSIPSDPDAHAPLLSVMLLGGRLLDYFIICTSWSECSRKSVLHAVRALAYRAAEELYARNMTPLRIQRLLRCIGTESTSKTLSTCPRSSVGCEIRFNIERRHFDHDSIVQTRNRLDHNSKRLHPEGMLSKVLPKICCVTSERTF
jgi:hypothetical protein